MASKQEILDILEGRRVIASISGGKDSAAMSLYLHELGIDHDRVFMDTGWESDITYEYIRGPLAAKLGPIEWIKAPMQMVERIRHYGFFPARHKRWCTSDLKIAPHAEYLKSRGDGVVVAVGIRHGESAARSQMPEWEWNVDFDREVWRPLIEWSEQDVIDIHTRNQLHPNPLYLKGARRVGCWPCIFSRKDEIRMLADIDPDRIALIRDLEREVTSITKRKVEARGEIFDGRPVAFFWGVGMNGKDRDFVPIDAAVEWSRTARGGKQLLLCDVEEPGCMRWGLCDAG